MTEVAPRRRGTTTGSSRRAELLSLAGDMFATKGFAQTTVRDIADGAGILSGSLYHHFTSKEAMLTELLSGFLDGLHSRFSAIVEAGDDPRADLDGLITESFRTIDAEQQAVALYQNEQAFLATVDGFDFVADRSRQIEELWIRVLEAGRTSGVFRSEIDAGLVYRFIRDGVWSTVRWYRPDGPLPAERLAEQYIQLLHAGLLAS
ncbi:MAG: TetR/AcrR family transcriptional regulator [Nocardioides sp.]|nr:TetR/AcrR family transcriptional regulator [Nocardioides sp.]